MTRQEFVENILDYYDLTQFCEENGLSSLDDVYDRDQWDEWVEDRLVDWARNNSWRDLYNILCDCDNDDGYDYYQYDDGEGRLCPIEFDELRSMVLEEADYEEVWDDENDEEDSESDYQEYESEDEIEEGCSIEEMFVDSKNCIQKFSMQELDAIGEGLRDVLSMIDGR